MASYSPPPGPDAALTDSRHCAYCLLPISGEQVKLCGGCRRRSYCSKNCQVLDWKTVQPVTEDNKHEQRGQGHRNWCKLACLEEDLDWRVIPIEGKGLGILALKSIPPRGRILVEGCQWTPQSHPGIQDLCGASLEKKWELNNLSCEEDEDVVCLRMSRANHDCRANAGHVFCKTFQVKILYAEREILAGEEICIRYQHFQTISDLSVSLSANKELCQQTLETKWGITCSQDCICKDAGLLEKLEHAARLDASIDNWRENLEQAMSDVGELLSLHDRIHSSYFQRRRTLYDGFQIGMVARKTWLQGMAYINELVGIMGDILHPKSAAMMEFKKYQSNPAQLFFALSEKGMDANY